MGYDSTQAPNPEAVETITAFPRFSRKGRAELRVGYGFHMGRPEVVLDIWRNEWGSEPTRSGKFLYLSLNEIPAAIRALERALELASNDGYQVRDDHR